MVDPNTISTRAELVTAIAEIVKRGGRSYADVAADSGVGVATVHAMANGTSFPRWTSLEPLLLTLCELTSHELDAWRGAHGRARADAAKDSRQSRDSDTVHPGRPASIEADVVRDNSPPEPPGEARAAAAPAGMAARTAPSRASAKFAAPNPTLEQLAEEIRLRLQHAEESLAVELPDALPVRWDEVAERAGDAWANIQRSRRTSPGALVHAAPIDLGGELKDILEVYKKVPSGRLVILGAGGQGKSVLAIRLSLDMLAEREQGDDVPVIIDLGAWRGDIPVNTWIRDQIIHHFPQMDDHAVAGLIDDRRILPVLDGFDQIAQDLRAAAMEALNVTPRRPMVLTCRTNSYPPNPGALLKNAAAIELQFLSCDEVADYLDTIGSEWETVTTAIRDQRGDCAVMNVLATPLMLFLARSVFGTSTGHGQDQSTAPARILDGRFADESVLRAHLLEGFVPSKFPIRHRRAADTTSGTQHWDRRPDLVPGWLGFLAAHAEATQTIAWWQLVDSVPRWFRVCVYVVLSAGLGLVATGPILGWDAALLITTVGAAVAGVYGWWHVGEPPYRVELAFGVRDRRFQQEALLGLPFGFCAAISGWFLVGSGGWRWLLLPIAGLVGGTVRAAVGAWWLGREKPFVSELVVIGFGGAAGGGFVGVVAACSTAPIGPLWGWLVIGSVAGLALGLASAPRVQISNETVSTAADMIARSRWFSLYFSGMSSVAYFVILYPLIGFGGTAISALIGTAMGLGNNAWGRWVLVTRLYLLGRVTPDILGFLDAAHQRGVLGQSGPVYQFRHEELRRTLKPTRRPTQFAPQ